MESRVLDHGGIHPSLFPSEISRGSRVGPFSSSSPPSIVSRAKRNGTPTRRSFTNGCRQRTAAQRRDTRSPRDSGQVGGESPPLIGPPRNGGNAARYRSGAKTRARAMRDAADTVVRQHIPPVNERIPPDIQGDIKRILNIVCNFPLIENTNGLCYIRKFF